MQYALLIYEDDALCGLDKNGPAYKKSSPNARADGRGAVFFLNAKDEAEAETIMESLPLAKEHLLDHSYLPVTPLKPLGLLLGSQPAPQ